MRHIGPGKHQLKLLQALESCKKGIGKARSVIQANNMYDWRFDGPDCKWTVKNNRSKVCMCIGDN